MRHLLRLTFFFMCFTAKSQNTNFDKGYKDGFAKGYCHNQQVTCIGKAPSFSPLPKLNESSNNYQHGYNQGFADGLEFKKQEQIKQKSVLTLQYKFNEYKSQIPDNGLSILAKKEKLFDERKEWIENRMGVIHKILMTDFVHLDSTEAGKWYNLMLDFQTKIGSRWPDLSENEVFEPMRKYLSDYSNSLVNQYNNIVNETNVNTIYYDNSKFQTTGEKFTLIVKYLNSDSVICDILQLQKSTGKYKTEENVRPILLGNYKLNYNGRETELCLLYIKKLDSYHYYFKHQISTGRVKQNDKMETTYAIAKTYNEGGHGNPILIKINDTSFLVFDMGQRVLVNSLGEKYYKLNQYEGKNNYIRTIYGKAPCWQDQKSGKKYFLNANNFNGIKIFEDELLLTNNIY